MPLFQQLLWRCTSICKIKMLRGAKKVRSHANHSMALLGYVCGCFTLADCGWFSACSFVCLPFPNFRTLQLPPKKLDSSKPEWKQLCAKRYAYAMCLLPSPFDLNVELVFFYIGLFIVSPNFGWKFQASWICGGFDYFQIPAPRSWRWLLPCLVDILILLWMIACIIVTFLILN